MHASWRRQGFWCEESLIQSVFREFIGANLYAAKFEEAMRLVRLKGERLNWRAVYGSGNSRRGWIEGNLDASLRVCDVDVSVFVLRLLHLDEYAISVLRKNLCCPVLAVVGEALYRIVNSGNRAIPHSSCLPKVAFSCELAIYPIHNSLIFGESNTRSQGYLRVVCKSSAIDQT